MSGLEVIGIVASIVQIADLGARISVKLCSFYRTVKDANQSMQSLSSDVSLTCSVLNELGNTLKQDEKAKLYSPEAFKTAQEVLSECKCVFEGIDRAMEEEKLENAKNAFLRRARKLTVAFMGPNLDVLKSNLERLKSTMMLMLHVIMYAGQIRQQKDKASLGDQQGLIKALMEDKRASDAKFQQLTKSIEGISLDTAASADRSIPQDQSMPIDSIIQVLAAKQEPGPMNKEDNELDKYYGLVCKLLQEIDLCQEFLENTRHFRMRNGVLSLHSTETVIMKHTHGDQSVCSYEEAFARALSSKVAPQRSHWHGKTHRKDHEDPPSSPFSSIVNRNYGPSPGTDDDLPDPGAINPEISGEELPPFHPERETVNEVRTNCPVEGHLVDDDKEMQNERTQSLQREASDALYDTANPFPPTTELVLSDREQRKIAHAENQLQQMEHDDGLKPLRARMGRRAQQSSNRRTNITEPLIERMRNSTDHHQQGEVPNHKGLGPEKSPVPLTLGLPDSSNTNTSHLFSDVDVKGQDEWPRLFQDDAASNVFWLDAVSFNAAATLTELKKGASVEPTRSMRRQELPRQNKQSMRDDDSQVENPWSLVEEGKKRKRAPPFFGCIVDQDTDSIPGECGHVPDPKDKPAPALADQVSKHPESHIPGNSLSTGMLLGSLDGLILRWTTLSANEISSL